MKNDILFAQDAKGICHILTSEEDGENGGYAMFKKVIIKKDDKPETFWVRIKTQKVNGEIFELSKDGNALYKINNEKYQMRHFIKVKKAEKELIISFNKEDEFSTRELLVDNSGIRYAVVHLDSGRTEYRQVWRD